MAINWKLGDGLDELSGSLTASDLNDYSEITPQGQNSIPERMPYDPRSITKYYSSFGGTDIVAVFSVPGGKDVTLGTIRTLSYSVVRDKRPLRLLGCMNPSTWSRSTRLIAGSLVFTSLDRYVWYELIGPLKDAKKAVMADVLPPFNITITAINEYGNASRLALLGVRLVDEGAVMGVDDLFIEQTHTFVAQDIVPWIPSSYDNEEL